MRVARIARPLLGLVGVRARINSNAHPHDQTSDSAVRMLARPTSRRLPGIATRYISGGRTAHDGWPANSVLPHEKGSVNVKTPAPIV